MFESNSIPIGLGLLRLTTEGRPDDIDGLAVIHFALNQGIRILDTADVYCLGEQDLHYGEHLARQAVASWKGPSEEVHILTKVGLSRPGGHWIPDGRPEHIRQSVDESLKALDRERLFLLQLHSRDPKVPFDETLSVLAELQSEGKVVHLGLCNVSIGEVKQAQQHFEVASVQNELSLLNRKSAADGVLQLTRDMGIPFLAHRPLGGYAKTSRLAQDAILQPLAQRHTGTPHQVALAAVRDASLNVVPLIGATKMANVRSSIESLRIALDVSDQMALSMKYSFEPSVSAQAALMPAQLPDGVNQLQSNQGPSSEPEVVLLMGIQGAGKSRLVQTYLEHGYARLNRDELGGKLDDLVPRLQQHLANGQTRVVLDNTYPTRLSRAPVIAAAHAYGIPVRCRHLQTPMIEAQKNIVLRMLERYGMPLGPDEMKMFRKMDPNLPPPQALAKWVGSYEPPSVDEGYSAVDEIPFQRDINPQHTQKGLLLDVDGTIRTTHSGEPYPRHPDDIDIMPNRIETLQQWLDDGYQLFFVSNQAGIAGGQVGHDAVQACLLCTAELLGLPITETVYCPHPHRPVSCFCRKPMPGWGVYLIQRHQLSLEHLTMVGDRDSDTLFAERIGARYYDAEEFFSG